MTELDRLAEQGRLSQVCPSCALIEAAGGYCTACTTPTGRATWQRDPRYTVRPPRQTSQRPDAVASGSDAHNAERGPSESPVLAAGPAPVEVPTGVSRSLPAAAHPATAGTTPTLGL